ncbi:MAG: hypothetical protein ACI9WS_002293 [Paraglaciecola psychrophila]|jgi:hypothetical protein
MLQHFALDAEAFGGVCRGVAPREHEVDRLWFQDFQLRYAGAC